jgi:hypothetical protein
MTTLNSMAAKNWPLLVSCAFSLVGVAVAGMFLKWNSLSFTIKVSDLASLLAPLAFAAAVVERAVEILVSPWRDAGASKLKKAVTAIKARPANAAQDQQNAADLKIASDALDEYRGDTQQYAFAVSLTLSGFVSIAGIRAFGPIVEAGQLPDAKLPSEAQHLFFLCVDVALSAALLAGGADGIHSVVNAFTSFFDATADKSSA